MSLSSNGAINPDLIYDCSNRERLFENSLEVAIYHFWHHILPNLLVPLTTASSSSVVVSYHHIKECHLAPQHMLSNQQLISYPPLLLSRLILPPLQRAHGEGATSYFKLAASFGKIMGSFSMMNFKRLPCLRSKDCSVKRSSGSSSSLLRSSRVGVIQQTL